MIPRISAAVHSQNELNRHTRPMHKKSHNNPNDTFQAILDGQTKRWRGVVVDRKPHIITFANEPILLIDAIKYE